MRSSANSDTLRELIFTKNNMTSQSYACLSYFLLENRSTKRLELGWNKLRLAEGFKNVCQSLGKNKKLKLLGLSWNNLGQGKLLCDEEKGCYWDATRSDANQYYISQQSEIDARFATYLNELIARMPLKH